MMSQVEIWHNPKCSKSRETLALLQERGIEPNIRLYLEDPPDAQALQRVLEILSMQPRQLMRTNEGIYQELGLDDASMSDSALIDAMVNNPILIERPVVLRAQSAAIGRPPQSVLRLFE